MIDPQLLSFSVLALALALTPGADMALVTRNALSRGRRAAVFTTIGICAACAIHAVASSLGLSAILATSTNAFDVVKVVGAGYLIYLGLRSLLSARTLGSAAAHTMHAPATPAPRPARSSMLEGMFTNLLNPKVAVLYLLVLQQFIAAGQPVLARSLILASIHIGFGFAVLVACTLLIDRLRPWLSAPAVQRRIEAVIGGVLVLLGLRLAIERR